MLEHITIESIVALIKGGVEAFRIIRDEAKTMNKENRHKAYTEALDALEQMDASNAALVRFLDQIAALQFTSEEERSASIRLLEEVANTGRHSGVGLWAEYDRAAGHCGEIYEINERYFKPSFFNNPKLFEANPALRTQCQTALNHLSESDGPYVSLLHHIVEEAHMSARLLLNYIQKRDVRDAEAEHHRFTQILNGLADLDDARKEMQTLMDEYRQLLQQP